jgi:hypothetical protein
MTRQSANERNAELGTQSLRGAGFQAHSSDWSGGTRGIEIPLETGHQVHISPPDKQQQGDPSWRIQLHPHPSAADGSGGMRLGASDAIQGRPRVSSPAATRNATWEDAYTTGFVSHHRDLPAKVGEFLAHPQVRSAISQDLAKRGRASASPVPSGPNRNLGAQFGG